MRLLLALFQNSFYMPQTWQLFLFFCPKVIARFVAYRMNFGKEQVAASSIIVYSIGIYVDWSILSKTRLSSWDITPFLDDWFLYLSGVCSGSRASFSWDIDTFFRWFEKWNQFGYVFALSLWLQVTGFSWDLLDYSFLSIKAFFSLWYSNATSTANFTWDLLARGLWAIFLGLLSLRLTFLHRPFGTFLFGCIPLGYIFTFLF